jgi:hypothetical protein
MRFWTPTLRINLAMCALAVRTLMPSGLTNSLVRSAYQQFQDLLFAGCESSNAIKGRTLHLTAGALNKNR